MDIKQLVLDELGDFDFGDKPDDYEVTLSESEVADLNPSPYEDMDDEEEVESEVEVDGSKEPERIPEPDLSTMSDEQLDACANAIWDTMNEDVPIEAKRWGLAMLEKLHKEEMDRADEVIANLDDERLRHDAEIEEEIERENEETARQQMLGL